MAALEEAGDLLWVTDPEGRIQHVNAAFEQSLGYAREDARGRLAADLLATDSLEGPPQREAGRAPAPGEARRGLVVVRDRDGGLRHLEETVAPMEAGGEIRGHVAVARDVTDAVTHRHMLAHGQRLARLGGWEYDPATDRAWWTEEAYRVLGVPVHLDPGPRTLLPRIHPEDRERVHRALADALGGDGPYEAEFRVRDEDGGERTVRSRAGVERGESGQVVRLVGVVQDVSELRAAEERAWRLAYYDGLTGLPNRQLFCERMDQALPHLGRHERAGAVVLLDLDRFGAINQELGAAGGDRVLKTAAERLGRELRPGDLLARFDSDLFAVFFDDIDRQDQVPPLLERLREALGCPLPTGEGEVLVTACMGVALYPGGGRSAGDLLQAAESALQGARDKGRNRYELYHRIMRVRGDTDLGLEAELHRAVEREELHLEYQPQVALDGEHIVGVEALLRWQRPGGEAVSPARFVPVLEETGLIQGVGEWVLERACHQARQWCRGPDGRPPRLSVNLSVRQFADPERLCRSVFRALERSGLDPDCLELEITEGLFLDPHLNPRGSIERLRERGVRVALDDFGTGYSALGYLHRFPLDTLKIDQCFIRDLDAPRAEGLVQGILNLARPFDLTVVAEGVETAEHARRLHELGCPLAQGFGYARPQPAAALGGLLADGGRLPLHATL